MDCIWVLVMFTLRLLARLEVGSRRYCGEWPGNTNNGTAHARWCGVELEEDIRGGGHGWVQVSIVTQPVVNKYWWARQCTECLHESDRDKLPIDEAQLLLLWRTRRNRLFGQFYWVKIMIFEVSNLHLKAYYTSYSLGIRLSLSVSFWPDKWKWQRQKVSSKFGKRSCIFSPTDRSAGVISSPLPH